MSVFVYVMWVIKSKDCRFLSSTEVGPVRCLQFCLPVESWGISPQTSTAHSLLIFHSLSLLLNSANYVQLPVSFDAALFGFDVSINAKETGSKS